MTDPGLEELLRELAPQVLGVLVRRYGQFDACEDATQEAMLQAVAQWRAEGVPASPRGWVAPPPLRGPSAERRVAAPDRRATQRERPAAPGARPRRRGPAAGGSRRGRPRRRRGPRPALSLLPSVPVRAEPD